MIDALSPFAAMVILAFGLWLVWIAIEMAFDPEAMRGLLSRMASSHKVNITEQAIRGIFGAALVIRAGQSDWLALFHYGGWFIVVTSLILLVVPLRWHAGYAQWWADKLKAPIVRLLSPVALLFGAKVIDLLL